jgi:excinuclease ABC subunit A
VSHTAAALAGVLAAGPYADRPKYDPHAPEAAREGDIPLEAVGRDAQMPWEADGRRWHTVERVTSEGKPCRWDGQILEWLDEKIHEQGAFADTNWKHRTVIEIAGPSRSQGWFLHAMTGQEWLLRLVFRVGRNTFKQEDLVRRLAIPPLNDTPGLEVYGAEERVHVANLKGSPWQAVSLVVHRLGEIDTPAFAAFLTRAAGSFHQNLKRLRTKPEDVMPWRVDGRRWHLGEKGFPVGKKVQWEPALLSRLLGLVQQVEPGLEVVWDARAAVSLKLPEIGRSWAQWRTKEAYGLDCRFLGKSGQFNLSQVESFGVAPAINGSRRDGDVLRLIFQREDHLHADRLKEVLAEHLRGFREVFGKGG